MNLETAQFVLRACENADTFFADACEDMPSLYENYSGRGMYGETTTGIVCGNPLTVLAAVIAEAIVMESEEFTKSHNSMMAELSRLRQDNLGKQIIIY